jgi:hypothetical protein
VSDASMTVGAFSVPPGAPTLAGISAARAVSASSMALIVLIWDPDFVT